jgi:sterol 3beta-glucosyltransferase
MRFAIVTVGSQGDVRPYIALAHELQMNGHEVVIATWHHFYQLVRDAGFECIPMQTFGFHGKTSYFTRFIVSILISIENKEDYLVSLWDACHEAEADVIIYNPSAYACLYIAESLGIPSFGAFVQPVHPTKAFPAPFLTSGRPWGGIFNKAIYYIHGFLHWQYVRKNINKWRKNTLHLPALSFGDTLLRQMRRIQPYILYAYSPSLVPRPSDWNSKRVEITGYWFLEKKGFAPPEGLEEFLRSGPPPVFISVVYNLDKFDKEVVSRMSRLLDARIIVHDLYAEMKEMVSTEKVFYVTGSIPHEWLFKRVSIAVHHGGLGICMNCIRAEVPMIAIPANGLNDHRFWAYVVAKSGVGMHLTVSYGNKLFVRRLSAAIRKMMNCADMKKSIVEMNKKIMAENGLKNAVRFILKEVGERYA